MISQFLRIEAEGLDDFVVYSPADLDFLDDLREKSGLTRDEIRTIAEHIGYNESYFIEDGNIIYIANLSINHAAEEAAHFIHTVCAGKRRKNLGQVKDFYCRVMREAIGFFGSKIVNHKRPCYSLDDLRNPRRRFPNKPPERIEELRTIGKYVRMHRRYEQAFLSKQRPWDLEAPIYELPLRIHVGITHVLGYMLGSRLFESLMNAKTEKETIRRLFFLNFSKLSESLTTYQHLISTLR
jgi:hypothetical protein